MKIFFVKIACVCLLFSACKSGSNESKDLVTNMKLEEANAPASGDKTSNSLAQVSLNNATVTADTTSVTIPLQGAPPPVDDWDKKIIKTAKIALELKDYNPFNTAMHGKLKMYGAYVAQEQQVQTDFKIQNDIVIKVPVDKFDDLVNSLGGADVKLLEKTISSDDVTAELVDTKSRIEAKEQVRLQYLQLLKQAKKMEDILLVQNQINSIQEDLEAAQGRVKYLSHQAAYSTINLSYFQYLNGGNANNTEPSYFLKLKDALANGGAIISNTLLALMSIWPLLFAGVFAWVYLKKIKVKKA